MAAEIQLLAAVEEALRIFGRPRKNPGKTRPPVVLEDGLTVTRLKAADMLRIKHLSLPGAFQYARFVTESKPGTVKAAKRAFCEKFAGVPAAGNEYSADLVDSTLVWIDRDTPDTRELQRVLKATQKKLAKARVGRATPS